jgi:Tol biopolymer transport system component
MVSVRAMLVPAAVILSAVGVVGCSGGGDASPTALRSLSPPSFLQHTSISGPWSAPVNLGPVINSTFDELGPAISKNGLSLYFSSNRPGGSGGGDIWVAQRENKDAPWGAPVNLGSTVNTPATEDTPAFSRDGHRMFFVSTRGGGFGAIDIWVSFREDVNDDFGWQSPVNVGSPINTSFNDAGPSSVRVSGKEFLFFNSNRPAAFAAANIWMSVRQKDGSFATPVLVAELNSNVAEARPAVRRDGREVFFYSNRPGSVGTFDLWTSTRESVKAAWSTPTNLGAVVNSTFVDQQPAISRDARTLFFGSDRPGGFGAWDLYMSTRGNHVSDDGNDDSDESNDDSDD